MPQTITKGLFFSTQTRPANFQKMFLFFFFQNDYFESEEACGVNSVVLFYK